MDPSQFVNRHGGLMPRQIFLPAHLTHYYSTTESISSEDQSAKSWPSTRAVSPQASNITAIPSAHPEKSTVASDLEMKPKEPVMPVISNLTTSVAHETVLASERAVSSIAADQLGNQSGASSPNYRGRGRPKGWKPGKPYNPNKIIPTTAAAFRQARQVKPRPPPNGYPKRRGRPKAPPPQPRDIYCKIKAQFISFLCEWQACKAELHNLDTLRRHVYIVHGHHTTCRWAKCAHAQVPYSFKEDKAFKAHMEEAHLIPFAWHVGDGPKNSSGASAKRETADQDDIPDYLKDENGNQVTPSVKDQRLEDFATRKRNRQRLKELMLRRDENLSAESDEVTGSF